MHPPTQCTDEKALAKVVKPEDINNAIAWYEHHWANIADALPVTYQGVTYSPKWQAVMDYQTLPAWREGRLPMRLAQAYIYTALRSICGAIKK
ncbi:hypothetical protein N836_35730 [Leptolyngbya sp. Heron Island J]|uniref:hypothetical protein n=1 Tax=Leptolyngbya sp. Heron Island J TaxID=1385935 RepID=UPI0003B9A8E4|nr:hypothetical protein [Leptolyngbya sp. Heron Island J]ESA37726.1 hypothetical protein N836_35730 [Leptolyngbya sp. Heron Island J]